MPAKPNYKFDKRQRDLAKKKEQDAKLARKRAKNAAKDAPAGERPAEESPPREA